jgi:DNA-directed RNA polymerase sigma subunit (sigma70/sigma32)
MKDKEYKEILEVISEKLKLPLGGVRKYLPKLYIKEREVLIKRLYNGFSLNVCGEIFGKVTGEYVRQIQQKGERVLRECIENKGKPKKLIKET